MIVRKNCAHKGTKIVRTKGTKSVHTKCAHTKCAQSGPPILYIVPKSKREPFTRLCTKIVHTKMCAQKAHIVRNWITQNASVPKTNAYVPKSKRWSFQKLCAKRHINCAQSGSP